MSGQKDIAALRQAFFGSPADDAATFYATVTAVDEATRTCTVEAEGIPYEDVLLHAVADTGKKGFCFVPAVGSTVLVSRIGGSNELLVAMFSEVDKTLLTIGDKMTANLDVDGLTLAAGDTRLEATADGLELTRGGAGLLKTLSDLCDALTKLTVSTAVGPSSVPINIADFQKIKQDLNNYLKG